ncbi:hypothetical protein BDF14DRAFT_1759898 [Spinellus fusiger]|nr:hypothetical protein BDF14DRAFT_1759898 [Spinellus fusiger]
MCDLSDPRILESYHSIIDSEPTNWLILGYNDTRDTLSLYARGTQGISEFRQHLLNEIMYGFVRVEDRFAVITFMPDQVSGVRRARALVHSRSVVSLFQMNHAQITAASLKDLNDTIIRTKLKLDGNQVPNRPRPTSMSERKRASVSARRKSSQLRSPSPSTGIPSSASSSSREGDYSRRSSLYITTEEPETFIVGRETFPLTPSASMSSLPPYGSSKPGDGSATATTDPPYSRPQTPQTLHRQPSQTLHKQPSQTLQRQTSQMFTPQILQPYQRAQTFQTPQTFNSYQKQQGPYQQAQYDHNVFPTQQYPDKSEPVMADVLEDVNRQEYHQQQQQQVEQKIQTQTQAQSQIQIQELQLKTQQQAEQQQVHQQKQLKDQQTSVEQQPLVVQQPMTPVVEEPIETIEEVEQLKDNTIL